jgi:hypothetical protein
MADAGRQASFGVGRDHIYTATHIAGANSVTTDEHTFHGLRDMALTASPAGLNLQLDDSEVTAFGVLMEIGFPAATITLTSFVSGDASLYFSTGGGIIGGIGHESVRKAARRFVDSAQQFLGKMEKAAEFPLPAKGKTRFYAITNHGVYRSIEFSENDLVDKMSEFSPLFYAGQDVISQIRLSQPPAR